MRVAFAHLGREHLGVEYLSAELKKAGHQVMLALDPGLFGINDNVFYIPVLERLFDRKKKVVDEVLKYEPHLVGLPLYTNTYQWALDVARQLKGRTEAKVVMGGIHATLVPEKVIKEPCVDFVIVGEGEAALVELLECMDKGRGFELVRNLWFKRNGRIWRNSIRPPIADIDSLPLPDKTIFEKDINFSDDYLLMASRGCIFSCSYCCESFLNNLYRHRFYRKRSVDSVMVELHEMKSRYNYKEVMFNDSILLIDRKWLRALLERYRAEIGLPFRCFGQVNYLDQELGELLKWGGCYAIEFGVQTLNESLKREVLRRFEGNDNCDRAFSACDKLGLHYDVDHMFGLPGETVQDHVFAARFYSRFKYLNRIKCHNLTYFPQLEIVDIAKNYGVVGQDDVENMEEGRVNDFFHGHTLAKPTAEARSARDFQALFKILPILPGSFVDLILRRKLYRFFGKLPAPLIVFVQIIVALKGRDYRYILYLKYYALRIRRALFN